MKILSKRQLKELVLYSPQHIARLEAAGNFPKRVEWEIPRILKEYALIDEIEEDRIYGLLETCKDPEYVLRPIVRRAYRAHYNPSGLVV